MYVYLCIYVQCTCSVLRSQKRVSYPLVLESQVTVSCPMWFIGTKFRFSARAAATEPALYLFRGGFYPRETLSLEKILFWVLKELLHVWNPKAGSRLS